MKNKINAAFSKFPETLRKPTKVIYYGTAGYRDSSEHLLNVLCRASLIAYIRSSTFCGKIIGIMITASHNRNTDNGIKIIDHNGDYIDKTLEVYCDEIVNCEDRDLQRLLGRIHRKMGNMRDFGDGIIPTIAIGRDTRVSGILFEEKIKEVLELFGAKVILYNVVTTPQMHFLIRNSNLSGKKIEKNDYFEHLVKNYNEIMKYTSNKPLKIYVDCANGVGGIAINELVNRIPNKEIVIINQGQEGSSDLNFIPNFDLLNNKCGADFVVTNSVPPENISISTEELKRCAAFDGDADRLIYFSIDTNFTVIDGDRQALFFANYICEMIKAVKGLSIGVVLSHYSNTAAKNALNDRINITIANTGVKNFVAKSREFDFGIFFEPNGHGSVTFSSNAIRYIEDCLTKFDISSQVYKNGKILQAMSNIFDPSIGDAVANFLVTEAISSENTYDEVISLYEKLPTRQLTVKIKDKKTLKMESDVDFIEPRELRDKIKIFCNKFKGRSFVRPSGTEDVIRVFAEANRNEDCDALCVNVAQAVYDICDGIGYYPEIKY